MVPLTATSKHAWSGAGTNRKTASRRPLQNPSGYFDQAQPLFSNSPDLPTLDHFNRSFALSFAMKILWCRENADKSPHVKLHPATRASRLLVSIFSGRCHLSGLPRNQIGKVAVLLQSCHAILVRVVCFTSHPATVRFQSRQQIVRWRTEQENTQTR